MKIDEKWGFIDLTGKEIIPAKYSEAYPFDDGLALVKIREAPSFITKCGFIDKTGKEVIPIIYDEAKVLHIHVEGAHPKGAYAWVRLDNKKFFVDKTGMEIKWTK